MHTEEEIACACVDGRIGGWADAYFMRLSSSSGFRPPTLSEMAFSDFSWLTTKTTAFTCSFCGGQGWQADEGIVSTGSEGNEGEERGIRPSRAGKGLSGLSLASVVKSYLQIFGFDWRKPRSLPERFLQPHRANVEADALYAAPHLALARGRHLRPLLPLCLRTDSRLICHSWLGCQTPVQKRSPFRAGATTRVPRGGATQRE